METDAKIADLARAQHGLVTWTELRDAGVTRSQLRARLGRGSLERVQPRVYGVTGAPHTWERAVLAAALSAGPDAAASHRAAAALWGLDGPFGGWVEITMPRARAVELPGIVAHRTSDLDAEHLTVRHAIPVTKPARTLVDLGAVCSRALVDRAIDSAVASKLVTLEGLWWMLSEVARRGRSGAGVLRDCLEWRFGVPASVLEGLFLRIVRDFDLPEPALQYPVKVDGRWRYLDAAYPDRMLAIELDGAKKRMSPAALQADVERQNELVAEGFTFLRFTWEDLTARAAKVAGGVRRMHDRLPVVPRELERGTAA